MDNNKVEKIDTKEYASTRSLNYKFGDEFFYPSDIEFSTYDEMKDRDETIASAFDVFIGSVMNMIGEYQHEEPAVKEFIMEKFNLQNKTLRAALKEVVSDSFAYGFGVAEELWSVENLQVSVKLRRIDPAPPFYVRFVADENDITGVRFYSTKGIKITVPVGKTLIFKNGSGVYGKSKLRSIYRVWKFKKEMFKWFARGSERFSTPLLVGNVMNPTKFTEEFADGWNESAVAVGETEKISALSPGSDMADSFIKTLDFLNKLLYRGLLVPQLIMDSSDTGAYAMSQTHMEVYKSNVRDATMSLSNDLINQVVSRMVQYQFGTKQNYGKFDIVDIPTNTDMNLLADVITKLTGAGVVDPLEPFIRDKFKFPEAEDDFLSAIKDDADVK